MMKSLIKKILLEETDDEFSWVPKGYDLALGKNFEEEDICEDCRVSFDDEFFYFRLDYNDWLDNFTDLSENDNWILSALLYGDTIDHDLYIEDDEINYVALTQDNINTLKEIFVLLDLGDFREYYDNDRLLEVFDKLNSIKKTNYLVNDILYAIQKAIADNRYDAIRAEYNTLKDQMVVEIGATIEIDRGLVLVKIPFGFVLNELNKGSDLTNIVRKVSEYLDRNWSDMYYDNYDTSGSFDEVNNIIDNYLSDLLEELEDSGKYENFVNLNKVLRKLKFNETRTNTWNKYISEKNQDIKMVVDTPNYDTGEITLTIKILSPRPEKTYQYRIHFDEIGDYAFTYKLNLD